MKDLIIIGGGNAGVEAWLVCRANRLLLPAVRVLPLYYQLINI